MKILHLLLPVLIATIGSINAPAQTADEIINKWMEAMGGKDKLGDIKTIYTEDELNIMNNIGPRKSYKKNGKGFKSETDFNGQKIIDCYTSDSGWSVNPLAGISTPTNMPAEQVKLGQLQLDAAGPLYDYAAKGSKAELQGKENLSGAASYKLKLTTATGVEMNFFIDSTNYYILKEVTKMSTGGQDIEIVTVNSDYRKTEDGFVKSFSQEITFPGLTFTITSRKIEINKEIDPDIFEKPKN
jgi:hypothetical protein